MANEIVTEIRLDLDKMRADLKQAVQEAKDAGEKSGKGLGEGLETGIGKALGGMKAAFAAAAAAIGGAFTLKESISAAIEQESAINALNSAMALSGTFSAGASQHLQDLASSLQKTTVFADETIVSGEALLVTMGKLSGQGLDRATKASLDMAAALGIDAAQAFNLVSKAATGHVEALGRYGVQVKKTGDDTLTFNNALDALEKKFKGFADLQTGTFAGAMAQTKNQFGEILESIGNIIIKSPTVIAVLNALAKAFAQGADAISKWADGRDIIGELGKALIVFGGYVNTYFIAPLEFAFNIIRTGVAATATMFTGLISIIALVGSAVTDFLVKPIADLVGGALGKLVSLVDKDMGASLTNFIQTATQATADGLKSIGDQAAVITTTLADSTTEAANKVFDFNVAGGIEKYLAQADEFFTAVTPPVVANFQKISDESKAALGSPTFFDNFAQGFKDAALRMIDDGKRLGAAINGVVNTGLTNSFAAMGAAMAKGQNGFEAFGKALLGVLGDVAIQFGTTFIAMGIAKTLLFDPTGPLLIAAGASLAIIGGALKAFAGGGGGVPSTGGAGGGGGGGVATGGGAAVDPNNQAVAFNEQERKDVGTKVEVNIAGNVLDRRETGMHIADVINETFGSNGITFATGQA